LNGNDKYKMLTLDRMIAPVDFSHIDAAGCNHTVIDYHLAAADCCSRSYKHLKHDKIYF
jgi:hypothetical protein